MNVSMNWELGLQRLKEARLEARRSHRARRRGEGSALAAPAAALPSMWRELRGWAGCRMIDLGCRVARPAVVAGARRGM